MLTFDKLLSAYVDYLSTDEDIEIITTKKGYVGLTWDSERCVLCETEFLETPEAMKEFILSSYETLQQVHITKGKRDLTDEEVAKVKTMVQAMSDLCT